MWEPATEIEQRMREALRSGRQEEYFQLLARQELLLPVAGDEAGGEASWATWSAEDRTHILAFTSHEAMRACLRSHAGAFRTVRFTSLADSWPDGDWWLAINPGLPIEGYLPSWFVTQVAAGDASLPDAPGTADPAPTTPAPGDNGVLPAPPPQRAGRGLTTSNGETLPTRSPAWTGDTEPPAHPPRYGDSFGNYSSPPPFGNAPEPAEPEPSEPSFDGSRIGFDTARPADSGSSGTDPGRYGSDLSQRSTDRSADGGLPQRSAFDTEAFPTSPTYDSAPHQDYRAGSAFSGGFGADPARDGAVAGSHDRQTGSYERSAGSHDPAASRPGESSFGAAAPRFDNHSSTPEPPVSNGAWSTASDPGSAQPESFPVTDAAAPAAPAAPASPAEWPDETSVEDQLAAAAAGGDTKAFLETLMRSWAYVPIAAEGPDSALPGDPEFRWHTDLIEGEYTVTAFTTRVRLTARYGDIRYVRTTFARLAQGWPGVEYSLYVNPGTEVGANMPGPQITTFVNWARSTGLLTEAMEVEQAARTSAAADQARVPELMQKVIPHHQVSMILERGYDRVAGFVHRYADVADLATPEQLYRGLGLLREGSGFALTDDSVHVISWVGHRTELYQIAYGGNDPRAAQARGGWIVEPPPFVGDGYAPNEDGRRIPEYKVDSVRLPHGARIYRLTADGGSSEVASYDADRREWLRSDVAVRPTWDPTPGGPFDQEQQHV